MGEIIDWPAGLPARTLPNPVYISGYERGDYNPSSGYYDYNSSNSPAQWGNPVISFPPAFIVGDSHPGIVWDEEKGEYVLEGQQSPAPEIFDNLAEGKCPVCEAACSLKRRTSVATGGGPYQFTHGKTTHLFTLAELRGKGWKRTPESFPAVCREVCPGKDASRDRKAFGGYFK